MAGSLAAARRDELAELNQATEQDFLQVGEKLQRISGGLEPDLGTMFASWWDSSPEKRRTGERSDLRSILERARAMAGQAESNRQALEQMLAGVSAHHAAAGGPEREDAQFPGDGHLDSHRRVAA